MQMNDDCIVEIIEHLDWPDMWIMANVSIRLRELAQRAFSSKYKNGVFNMANVLSYDFTDFFRIFGSLIRSILINFVSWKSLCSLQEHCELLTSLDTGLSNIEHVSDEDTKLLIPLFSRLQTLKWNHGRIPDKLLKIFSGTELHLVHTKVCNNNAGEMSLSRLKKLIIRGNADNGSVISNFLNLLNHPKSVEYLQISTTFQQLSAYEVPNFENLTTLTLFDRTHSGTFEEFIDLFKQLRHLSNLTFSQKIILRFRPVNLLALIENCKNLERLIVDSFGYKEFSSNSEVFRTILNVLSQRPNKNQLNSILIQMGHSSTPFNVALPVQNLFKITYMSMQTACSTLKRKVDMTFIDSMLSQHENEILHNHTLRMVD